MTQEKKVNGWKVRVVIPGSFLHFVSATEPVVVRRNGRIVSVEWTPTDEGDTPGFIDWASVAAITWRDSGE